MSKIQILTDAHFGVTKTKGGGMFVLYPPDDHIATLCMFGIWNRHNPNPPSDQAYVNLKQVTERLPEGVVCSVVDIQKNPNVVGLSRKTQTEINTIPKLVLFGPDGVIVDIFSGSVQKTVSAMLDFTLKRIPKPRPKKTSRGRRYDGVAESDEEEDEEDEYEAPEPRRKKASGGYYAPEFGKAPRLGRNVIRGQAIEQEDGEEFLIPDDVIPHNKPWNNHN